MILFFKTPQQSVIATEVDHQLNQQEIDELCWLYGGATLEKADKLTGVFVGPRREMVTLRRSASRNGDPLVNECC